MCFNFYVKVHQYMYMYNAGLWSSYGRVLHLLSCTFSVVCLLRYSGRTVPRFPVKREKKITSNF